jgi:hypothetical protein
MKEVRAFDGLRIQRRRALELVRRDIDLERRSPVIDHGHSLVTAERRAPDCTQMTPAAETTILPPDVVA